MAINHRARPSQPRAAPLMAFTARTQTAIGTP